MLADENGVSIKVAKYAGTTKVDLVENEEYGYCSLIKATNHVLEKLKIENVTKAKVTSTKRIEEKKDKIYIADTTPSSLILKMPLTFLPEN